MQLQRAGNIAEAEEIFAQLRRTLDDELFAESRQFFERAYRNLLAPLPKRQLEVQLRNESTADYLRSHGHDVQPNPIEHIRGAGRQGDRYVDGILTEFKHPNVECDSNTIRNEVNGSLSGPGQARVMIIDARGTELTLEEAERGIRRAMGISRGKLDVLRIIGDGFDIHN